MNLATQKKFLLRLLRPRTKKGKVVLWAGGFAVLCRILFDLTGHMRGWGIFATIIALPPALWMFAGWCRRRALWRLRHRLIVTYIFIGVIPILLLGAMAFVSGYIVAGQFATYVASSYLQSELVHLEAANSALATELSTLDKSGKLSSDVTRDLAAVTAASFPNRTITVWRGDKPVLLFTTEKPEKLYSTATAEQTDQAKKPSRSARAGERAMERLSAHSSLPLLLRRKDAKGKPSPLAGDPLLVSPPAAHEDFSHFVVDSSGFYARAVNHISGAQPLIVVSSVPVTPAMLQPAGAQLGTVGISPPEWDGNTVVDHPADDSGPRSFATVKSGKSPRSAGTFDWPVRFLTFIDVYKWDTGKKATGTINVLTRPSVLYNTLFAALGDKAVVLEKGLLGLAAFFGFIEFVALIIGLFLSRSITGAVAKLYSATEHVNRGDLTHRIRVKGRDQMAALEHSFNNMTESLVGLLAEQKEKQRLESELAIAQQVQDLLFPHKTKEFSALEVYGFCRPARSVSGDYYDFIPTGSDSLMLAVGDISGKGVSAALLMATVHAFVRAYSLEPINVRGPKDPQSGPIYDGDHSMYYRSGGGPENPQLAPGTLMTTLNYQLFHCTPPEKYATMFLGCYDAVAQELTYCNAGHLPPMMVRADGTVFRLGVSGTVVGLFDGATYEKSSIGMQSGDLFVAFSDGVTEPENDNGEFGEDRLIALLREHHNQPLPRISEVIIGAVTDWIGHAEQPDDVTVVLARAR